MQTGKALTDAPLVPPADVAGWLDRLPQPVAVTGGTGFVGSHLVDTLCAAGLRPRVLVRDSANPRWISDRPVQWVEGSLERSEALARLVDGAGTVIHLAGIVTADSAAEFDRGNARGTVRLVTAVRGGAPRARFVYVSSLAAVGPAPGPDGLGPEAKPAPVSDYGRSKLAGERAMTALAAEGWWCVIRPPAIYGPRDTDMFELFKMARRGLAAIPSGERWLSVAHVSDVVRCVLAAAGSTDRGRTYHLGEPAPYRLDDLIRRLAAAMNRRVRVIQVPPATLSVVAGLAGPLRRVGLWHTALTRDKAREALERCWTARTADSLAALGVGEQVSLDAGAGATWEWYRARGWLG